jgi:hypothetical protein
MQPPSKYNNNQKSRTIRHTPIHKSNSDNGGSIGIGLTLQKNYKRIIVLLLLLITAIWLLRPISIMPKPKPMMTGGGGGGGGGGTRKAPEVFSQILFDTSEILRKFN